MNLDALEVLSIINRWIHIVTVVVAIGGSVFMRVVLMPAAHAVLSEDVHNKLRVQLMARWRNVVHVSVAVLIVTGFVNILISLKENVPPMPYHALFGVKLIGALIVFFLAIALAGSSPGFSKFREQRGKWLSVQIVLAAVIILLSGLLKSVHQAALIAQ